MKLYILIVALFSGCISIGKTNPTVDYVEVKNCLEQQISLYGDLCAESSVGYEEMQGSEGHYEGVKCAVQSALWCIEDAVNNTIKD